VANLKHLLAACRIPHPGALVLAAGSQASAIRAERHIPHGAIVADFEQFPAAGRIPDPGGLVVSSRGQSGAIRAERHTVNQTEHACGLDCQLFPDFFTG